MIQYVALGIACFGAVLSLINTWHSLNKDKPRLRVRFLNTYSMDRAAHIGHCIEVTNLGTIPLVVCEIGFSLSPWWKRDLERQVFYPQDSFGSQIPIKVESRQQANFYIPIFHDQRFDKPVRAAYAKTECGLYFRGTTPALLHATKQLVK